MIALLIAAAVAFAISVFITPVLMKVLRRKELGQHIRDDGPIVHPHAAKAGTPTMGGIAIVAGVLVGYFISHTRTGFVFGRGTLVIVFLLVGMAIVGLCDDYLGLVKKRNLGLRKRGKIIGQLLVAGTFSYLIVDFVNLPTTISFGKKIGFISTESWNLPTWLYLAVCIFIIIGAVNAVNITDGLDGLAAGSAILVFSVYTVMSYWQFRNAGIYAPDVASYGPNALDRAVLCAAIAGACAGFLWWNAAPAQIFMGDVGSLALGGAMAGVAIATKTELLLIVIGGIYVIETLSVIAQMISYRGFKKRVLKMAPLHHHFEVLGWPETTVIVRFWLLSGVCAAMGIGIFYASFVRAGFLV